MLFPQDRWAANPCLGLIDSIKFCTKPLEGSTTSCGTIHHGISNFTISSNTAYIKASESQFFCKPTLLLTTLTKKEQDIVLSAALIGSDWEKVFNAISSGSKPDWLTNVPPSSFTLPVMEHLTVDSVALSAPALKSPSASHS